MANVLADREAWTVKCACVENRKEENYITFLSIVRKQTHLLGWESEARGHHL